MLATVTDWPGDVTALSGGELERLARRKNAAGERARRELDRRARVSRARARLRRRERWSRRLWWLTSLSWRDAVFVALSVAIVVIVVGALVTP